MWPPFQNEFRLSLRPTSSAMNRSFATLRRSTTRTDYGQNALHIAVKRVPVKKAVRLCVGAAGEGIDVNHRDKFGRMYMACRFGDKLGHRKTAEGRGRPQRSGKPVRPLTPAGRGDQTRRHVSQRRPHQGRRRQKSHRIATFTSCSPTEPTRRSRIIRAGMCQDCSPNTPIHHGGLEITWVRRTQAERYHSLDFLRAVAMYLGVILHVTILFGSPDRILWSFYGEYYQDPVCYQVKGVFIFFGCSFSTSQAFSRRWYT